MLTTPTVIAMAMTQGRDIPGQKYRAYCAKPM